jgi:hypothetical protein
MKHEHGAPGLDMAISTGGIYGELAGRLEKVTT